MSENVRVAVVGAGAMGSLYGAKFSAAGNEVLFVDVDTSTVDAINDQGLTIVGPDGSADHFRIPATSDPTGMDPADIILFQIKGFATAAAAKLARPIVGPESVVLTLQNGVGNEETLRVAFPDTPLVIGVSMHSVTVLAPAQRHHTGIGETKLGPAEEQWYDHADRVAACLRPSGFEVLVKHASDIHVDIYAKWVLSCGALPVTSLTGLDDSSTNRHEDVLAIMDEIIREACALAAAAGHLLDAEERVAYTRSSFRTAGGKASMLQDIEAGRRTEIDFINGAAVRLADQYGIAAPLNRAMYALVKGREAAMREGS